ncbi:MAG: helix-turn-helix domain-containing protein [Archangium sp.]
MSDAPLSVPRELLQQVLVGEAKRAVEQLPEISSFVALARAQVHDFPLLATLAQRLHVSPRTLQRRLARESSSHFELVDEVRRSEAARFEANGLSEKQIALELGFSDGRALSRARRRWK